MNAAVDCHAIEACPGLYVDAFRGSLLKKTRDANNSFILTHYHGDHYGSLPRDAKYQGPALIHCTPVTAALLRQVHLVPANFVVEHPYGETWTTNMNSAEREVAKISFYDANHCPGAAIVLITLPSGKCHLHTGDMRYCDKMKSYPLLQRAVESRALDLVYLDTTYGHPKHDFCPQEQAVDVIAQQVEESLKDTSKGSTLVLLSCYSIGKEKVLWESACRSDQLVCVSEKKLKLLQCIQRDGENELACSQIISKCTLDSSKSDIHVIPMGLAGEMWPYFRPNYFACMEYAEKLDKRYDRVLAFLPTGWSHASNWNKKNAVTTKEVNYKGKSGTVQVEIRLVSYSEHSAFGELETFVSFLKPRRVIPTVFADENDRRKIENRFRNMIDSTRAKQDFFKLMTKANAGDGEHSRLVTRDTPAKQESLDTELRAVDYSSIMPKQQVPGTSSSSNKKRKQEAVASEDHINTLVAMGFNQLQAKNTLLRRANNVEAALNDLLSGSSAPTSGTSNQPIEIDEKQSTTSQSSSARTITSFFSKKQK